MVEDGFHEATALSSFELEVFPYAWRAEKDGRYTEEELCAVIVSLMCRGGYAKPALGSTAPVPLDREDPREFARRREANRLAWGQRQ